MPKDTSRMDDVKAARYERLTQHQYPSLASERNARIQEAEDKDIDQQVVRQIKAAKQEQETDMGGRKRRGGRSRKRKSRGGKRKTRRRA